jgi:pyridoxal phosphate enzyme (YggS family)
MSGFDADAVARALGAIRARIHAAGGDDAVAVLAVTKGFGPDVVTAAVAAGCTSIGENYAQELVAKRAVIDASVPRPEVHFIGQLQTNKVRLLASLVDVYETVDRAKLGSEIARRAPGASVLVQVDTTGQPGKGGCPLSELDALVESVLADGLELRGLMTVGPTPDQAAAGGPEAARLGFRAVRAAADRLGLSECSMGMSDDLEVAVQEGSTQVRIGSALFGPRPVHNQQDLVR